MTRTAQEIEIAIGAAMEALWADQRLDLEEAVATPIANTDALYVTGEAFAGDQRLIVSMVVDGDTVRDIETFDPTTDDPFSDLY